jgi:type IV secretory pathway TraG/TraD family ATPase VirD4
VIVYAMQSFSQAVTRWGAQRAQTMGTATTITAVLGGLTSPSDLADLERVCGQRRVRRESAHRTTGSSQNRDQSRTISWEGETVLRADQIRTLPAGVALVLWSRLPPFLAYLPLLSEMSGWREVQREEKAVRDANDRTRSHEDPGRGLPSSIPVPAKPTCV